MRSRVFVVIVAATVWALDALSKQWALAALNGHVVHIVGDIKLELTTNSGAAFSMGTSKTWVFTTVATLISLLIVWLAPRVTQRWWLVGLGGLLGGAVGNLTDRLTRPPGFGVGHVVDFIAFPNFPLFNVADMAIVGSVALMFLLSLRGIDHAEVRHG